MSVSSINQTENAIQICIMIGLGSLGVTAGITGIIVVMRNSFLRGIVRHYLFVDLTNFVLINGCHLVWGVPCALWGLDIPLPFLNFLFGDIVNGASCMGSFPKLFLGMNRFFAIAFDGHYHQKFARTKLVQYFLMLIWPLGTMLAFALPGCHALFIPNGQNFYFVQDGCGVIVMYYTQVLPPTVFLSLSTIFDGSVFIMMNRRVRQISKGRQQLSCQKADQIKKEYKLVLQMATNLIAGVVVTVAVAIGSDYVTSPMACFLMWTALWQGCCAVQCFTYVILLREPRAKSRTTLRVSIVTTTRHDY